MEWPCEDSEIGSPIFRKEGTTAAGAPYFGNGKVYLYFDPDCDGTSVPARWIVNDIEPDADAKADLDRDGKCSYMARKDSEALSGPPSGKWQVACNDTWMSMEVKITMAESSTSKPPRAHAGDREVAPAPAPSPVRTPATP